MADQTVTLRITADASGMVTGVGLANRELGALGGAGARAGAQVAGGMATAKRGVESISRQLRNLQNLAAVWAAFAGVRAVARDLIATADSMTQLNARLRIATDTAEAYAKAQGDVRAIAVAARADLESVATLYTRLAQSSASLGISQGQLAEITEAVSTATALSGGSAQAAAAGVQQLAQAFASGVLSGDEFRSVMENSPRIVKALTDSLGVSIRELRTLAEQQKLTADIVAQALRLQLETLRAEMAKTPQTVGQALGQTANAWALLVDSVNQAEGATASLASVISGVNRLLMDEAEAARGGSGAMDILASSIQIVVVAGVAIKNTWEAMVNVIAASVDILIASSKAILASLGDAVRTIVTYHAALQRLDFSGAWDAIAGAADRQSAILGNAKNEISGAFSAMADGVSEAGADIASAWGRMTKAQSAAVAVSKAQIASLQAPFSELAKAFREGDAGGLVSGIKAFGAALADGAKAPQTELDALRERIRLLVTGTKERSEAEKEAADAANALADATRDHARALIELEGGLSEAARAEADYKLAVMDAVEKANEQLRVGMAWADVERQLSASIDAAKASLDGKTDAIARQLAPADQLVADLEFELSLIRMSNVDRQVAIELRRLEGAVTDEQADRIGALIGEIESETLAKQESERATQDMARAWDRFAGSLADAVLDGSQGVKRWWKAMLEDMKAQLIKSGILALMQRLFGGGKGGFSLAGGGGGIGFGQIIGGMFGGGGGTGGNALGGLFNGGSWMQAGGNLGAGFMQAVPWLAAAGGALHGYRNSGVGAAIGYGALGYAAGSVGGMALLAGGTAAAAGGSAAAIGTATASGALAGAAAVPVIGWIIAAIAALDMVTGGKVFGTKYRPESSTSTIGISEEGFSADGTLTQVRNRSLFRGRKWETHAIDPGDEARAAAEAFYQSIFDTMTGAARSLAIDVPPMIDAAIRTVTEYDKKGRVKGIKVFADALGRTWEEAISDPNNKEEVEAAAARAASRINSEAIIAVIDAALGTTVERAIGGTSPIFGGGGGGGGRGPGRGGDDFTIPEFTGGASPLDAVTQTLGEASAIAERWRDNVEMLAEGAQFLLAAATDIRAGVGLLGEDGSLTAITNLIEELAVSGETLSQTYTRVATSAALWDQALAISGVAIDKTREEMVRFAVDITDAAGGLEQAKALWDSYFANFYSEAERAAYQRGQLRTAADAAFAGAGLDITQYLDTGGLERFRTDFEAAMPTMSPEDIAAWLRAADALAAVTASARQIDAQIADGAWQQYLDGLTESERAIAEVTKYYDDWRDSLIAAGATVEQLTAVEEQRTVALERQRAAAVDSILQPIVDDIERMQTALSDIGLSDYAREQARIARETQQAVTEAAAAGATQVELLTIEIRGLERAAIAAALAAANFASELADWEFEDYLAGLSEADAQLARTNRQWEERYLRAVEIFGEGSEEAIRVLDLWGNAVARAAAEAMAQYQGLVQGLQDEIDQAGMSEFAVTMRDIGRWTADTTASLNTAARAAGLQAASEGDLALVHQVAAQRAAAAIAQLRASAASLVTELFGPAEGSLDDLNARIAELEGLGGQISAGADRAGAAIDNLFERWMSGVESVQQYLDSMLLGDLSALTPEEQLAEARRQLEAAQAAALGGDADALTRLPQLADAYLRMTRQYEASGQDYNDQFDWVRSLLQAVTAIPNPGTQQADPGGGGGGYAAPPTSRELEELYAQRDALLAEQEAAHRLALMDQLGGMIRELIQATGEPLAEVAASIGLNLNDLATELGINLNDMSADTALALVDMARALGVDVAELAQNVGVSLGDLADRQSLLNQALDATLLDVPEDIRAQLEAPLEAVRNATSEADANAALAQLEDVTSDMPAGIRDLLAPFFDTIDPAPMTTELTRLSDIYDTAAAQLDAAVAANGFLERIASNLGAANAAANIPAFAAGGWVNGPTTLLAGEAGRELILPNPVSEFFQRAGIPINSGGDDDNREVVAELRALRAEVDALRKSQERSAQSVVGAVVKTGETSDRANDQSRTRLARERRGATA